MFARVPHLFQNLPFVKRSRACVHSELVPLKRIVLINKDRGMTSKNQEQTADVFGYKWGQENTYQSSAFFERNREYIISRYGDIENAAWWKDYGDRPKFLDAGCGAGLGARTLLGDRLHKIDYLGVDISEAYAVAQKQFEASGYSGRFMQADFTALPATVGLFDVILAEGVMHHTDNTEKAFHALVKRLAPRGRFLFYVYAKKGPIREFTDDYIREKIQEMSPKEGWNALTSLTEFGKTLGELNIEIDLPRGIDLLDIPAGRINLQRLFYWHVFKCYHRPDWTLEEMQHVNFDWYAPKNCHRHRKDEIERWCVAAQLEIERLDQQEAGFTVVAHKKMI